MFDTWKQKYQARKGQVDLTGWGFETEAGCRAYFSNRVRAKIQESDTTALLQEYLDEMADTGFDTSALQAQVQHPPQAKDWEIGEAFAEVMLEDRFEASFPWPTSWDKRTPKASLPGADMPGFCRRDGTKFLFGEVKSSSEAKSPPQVANSGDDCLHNQLRLLLTSGQHRQQLIEWLLVRACDSTKWKPILDEAIKRYADGEAHVCGVLVRGGTKPTIKDLSAVKEGLADVQSTFDVMLLGFYLPYNKAKWVELVYGAEAGN